MLGSTTKTKEQDCDAARTDYRPQWQTSLTAPRINHMEQANVCFLRRACVRVIKHRANETWLQAATLREDLNVTTVRS
jgi:hypothetical protein